MRLRLRSVLARNERLLLHGSREKRSPHGFRLGIAALLLLGLVENAFPQLGFDFAVDSFTVDGNILGSGNANGILDFVDDFNDGSVVSPPTSTFSCSNPVLESGGFLRLRSADGAKQSPDPTQGVVFLAKNCSLFGGYW